MKLRAFGNAGGEAANAFPQQGNAGSASWQQGSSYPAQQANLIEIVGQKLAPVSLSLNGSFLYIGFSLGAVLGSFTLSLSGITNIGAVAASCELVALVLMLIWLRRFGRYRY